MNLITQAITLPPFFGVTPEAEQQRNELVLRASEFKSITNSTEQNSAVEVARDIRSRIKDVEDTRTTIKKPLLDASRMLDALAKDYSGPLQAESTRIERLVTDFQQQEARRVAEAEAKRQLEIRRLQLAREAAEEEARKAAATLTNEADLAAAIAKEAEAKAKAEAAQAAIVAPLPSANKSKGVTTKQVMRWEVTDIHALYKARPELCSIEAKKSAINSTCVPEMPVPGLKMWWETDSTIRKW